MADAGGMSASAIKPSRRKRRVIPTLLESRGSRSLGQIINLSPRGLGITTAIYTLPRSQDRVRVRFVGAGGTAILASGEVRWATARPGGDLREPAFGLELDDPSGEYRRFFEHLED